MLEKFNEKYDDSKFINKNQYLKEFIESVDNTSRLKEFYNNEVKIIKESIKSSISKVKSKVIKIKLNEVTSLIKELDKKNYY